VCPVHLLRGQKDEMKKRGMGRKGKNLNEATTMFLVESQSQENIWWVCV